MTNSQIPNCPKCSGPMFDERKSKYWNAGKTKEGKDKPMFKCRDKDKCDGILWNEGGSAAAEAPNGNGAVAPIGPPLTFDELCKKYGECVNAVIGKLEPWLTGKGSTVSGEAVAMMSDTLFTERMRRGV